MRALVLDDSRAMRRILRKLLMELGFEVVEAGDGVEGLARMFDGGPFEIALVDWNMPEMDGLEFVRAVRKEATWRDMTLMMVTTESETDRVVAALAAGANEYVMKPFTRDTIQAKLELLGLVHRNA
jgi:two-component system chemotaxis response regulator CheY